MDVYHPVIAQQWSQQLREEENWKEREDVQVLTESIFAGGSEEHVCARGIGVQGLEYAVHITAAIIHGQKHEVDIWWEPFLVNDVLTGSLQHWQDLWQGHLVAVVLWQNHRSSDVAVCVGITDVAHELQNIYIKVTEGRLVVVCDVGTLSTAVLLQVTPACVNRLKTDETKVMEGGAVSGKRNSSSEVSWSKSHETLVVASL